MFPKFWKSKKHESSVKKDKDITLFVDNIPPQVPYIVKVPRSSLVEHSAVFRKMSENGEFRKSKEIKLKGVTVIGLQKMIEYIKGRSVNFQNYIEIIDTLKAAYMYQVAAVSDTCTNFLINTINCSNVCDIYEFSSSYSLQQVEYNCLKFIDRHAEEVLKSPSFLKLKTVTVTDIISRLSLDVSTEMAIFRAVMTWGFNDCLRRGVDSENTEDIFKAVKSLLGHVRFLALSLQEMSDPDVDKFYKLLTAEDLESKRRSLLNLESKTRTRTVDSSNLLGREYVQNYMYELEMMNCDEHAVKNGETFCMRIKGLKGRVFLTGVTLAFDRFVNSKNTSCLYVALSATNGKTTDQICVRGAFMISNEEASLKFPLPLIIKESENVEIALNVKRAENICPMIIKSASQIVIPESKNVALKIVPSSSTGMTERSMFKGIKYFY